MLRLAIREIFRRRLRAFLLALTVIITGSFMAAVLILGDSLIAGLEAAEIDGEVFLGGELGITLIRNILLFFNFLAYLVGVFVIANTFWVILSQRSYELALLRVIGASKGQVFGIVIWEALLVGIFGGLASILCGIGLAQGFFSLSDALSWEVNHVGLRFSPWVFILPMTLSVFFTFLAAILPAALASRRPPLASLTAVYGLVKNKHRLLLLLGLILVTLGGLLQALILFSMPPAQELNVLAASGVQLVRSLVFWFGQILTFAGVAFLAIPIAKWLAGGLRRLLSRSRLLSWRLAANNIWRQPTRTAFTANVLMIGIVLVAVITVMASSLQFTIIDIVNRERASDWTLQAAVETEEDLPDWVPVFPNFADDNPEAARITPAILQRLSEAEATDSVMGIRLAPVSQPGAGAETYVTFNDYLVSVDGEVLARLYEKVDLSEKALANLNKSQVLVSEDYLQDQAEGFRVGDSITLAYDPNRQEKRVDRFLEDPDFEIGSETPSAEAAEATFVIGGTFSTFSFDSGYWPPAFLVSHDAFYDFIGSDNYNIVEFNSAEGYSHEEVQQSLEGFLQANEDLALGGKLDIIKSVNLVIRWMINIFRALLALAIIVAIVGVLNTLMLAVSERSREIGLLRAIGASAGIMRRTLAVEAVFIATLGVALGIGLALLFAWGSLEVFVNQPSAAAVESLGGEGEEGLTRILFSIPWKELSFYYLVAVFLAWLASIVPALRATRIKIIEALRSA